MKEQRKNKQKLETKAWGALEWIQENNTVVVAWQERQIKTKNEKECDVKKDRNSTWCWVGNGAMMMEIVAIHNTHIVEDCYAWTEHKLESNETMKNFVETIV
jgi:hypothetical protein